MIKVSASKKLLDSSIWIGYFLGNLPESKKIVDSEDILYVSIISLHEIYKRIEKLVNSTAGEKAIDYIENNCTILNLDKNIAIAAAKNCRKYGLHTLDSLIYTTAIKSKLEFITADYDFLKTPNTKVIKH